MSEGKQVTVEDTGGREAFVLANESVLIRGLVLRSRSNQISIRFRSDQQHNSGVLQLHYQGETIIYICHHFFKISFLSCIEFKMAKIFHFGH